MIAFEKEKDNGFIIFSSDELMSRIVEVNQFPFVDGLKVYLSLLPFLQQNTPLHLGHDADQLLRGRLGFNDH